jgi:hypothetical protein
MTKTAFKNSVGSRNIINPPNQLSLLNKLSPYFIKLKNTTSMTEFKSLTRQIFIIVNTYKDPTLTILLNGIINIISSYGSINGKLQSIIIYPSVIPILKKSK